jgi:hypothetical protein
MHLDGAMSAGAPRAALPLSPDRSAGGEAADLPRFGRHRLLGRWLFDLDGYGFVSSYSAGETMASVASRRCVLEHGGLELEPRRPAAAVDELLLERAKNVSATALS